jgi:hypothetical protein
MPAGQNFQGRGIRNSNPQFAALLDRGFRSRRCGLVTAYVPSSPTDIMTLITTSKTIYVLTTGNDTNDGSANDTSHAFKTVGRAMQEIATYVLGNNGVVVTVQIGNGTYSEAVTVPVIVGNGTVTIQGDLTNQDNVIIQPPSAGIGFLTIGGGYVTISHVKVLSSSNNHTDSFRSNFGGDMILNSVTSGTCTNAHFNAQSHGFITLTGSCKVLGGATYCLLAYPFSAILFNGTTTLAVTGAYGSAFAAAFYNSTILIAGLTFSGTATGVRYLVRQNSCIDTSSGASSTFFPGNSVGSTASGGQYL